MARAMVRWLEAERSLEFLDQELARLPAGEIHDAPRESRPAALAAALVEGWRGEIVHAEVTDDRGEIRRYKIGPIAVSPTTSASDSRSTS